MDDMSTASNGMSSSEVAVRRMINDFRTEGAQVGYALGKQAGDEAASARLQSEVKAAYERGQNDRSAEEEALVEQSRRDGIAEGKRTAEAEAAIALRAAVSDAIDRAGRAKEEELTAAFRRGEAHNMWALREAAKRNPIDAFEFDPTKTVPEPLFYGQKDGPNLVDSSKAPPVCGNDLELSAAIAHGENLHWSEPSQTVSSVRLSDLRLSHNFFKPLKDLKITRDSTVGEFVKRVPLHEFLMLRYVSYGVWGEVTRIFPTHGIKIMIDVTS